VTLVRYSFETRSVSASNLNISTDQRVCSKEIENRSPILRLYHWLYVINDSAPRIFNTSLRDKCLDFDLTIQLKYLNFKGTKKTKNVEKIIIYFKKDELFLLTILFS